MITTNRSFELWLLLDQDRLKIFVLQYYRHTRSNETIFDQRQHIRFKSKVKFCRQSRIRTRIVGLKGNNADHRSKGITDSRLTCVSLLERPICIFIVALDLATIGRELILSRLVHHKFDYLDIIASTCQQHLGGPSGAHKKYRPNR